MKRTKLKFGTKIVAMRSRLGMTQSQLAEKADISVPYMGTIERNNANPSIATMVKICKALGVSLGEFSDEFVNIPERTAMDDAILLFLSDKTDEEKEWAFDMLKVLFKSK